MNDATTPYTILCVGRVYCDLVFTGTPRMPTMGTEVLAEDVSVHAGGGAFITAAYLQALGRHTYLAASLGSPPFDWIVADEIAMLGVDQALCASQPQSAGVQLTVAIAGEGDRAFLTRRTRAPVPIPTVEQIRKRRVRHMHIGELQTLVEHPELLDRARQCGLSTSLDCGWEDVLPPGAVDLVAEIDVFLPNEPEAERLLANGARHPLAPMTVIKRGADGADVLVDGTRISRPATRVEAVDTTGAGDAFNSGFLDEWLRGSPPETCLEMGNACGAAAIAGRGGCGGLKDVHELLAVRQRREMASD